MRERAEHKPVPYWVHLDAAAEGLFAQGEDGVALAAVLAGTGLRMDRYFLGKLLQAAVSAVLAYMTVRFFA